MIYSLFGSNRPVVLGLLAIPAVVFGVLAALYSVPPETVFGGPVFSGLIFLIPGAVSQLIAGLVVNIAAAILVNKLYNDHDYAERENYFPALFYFLFVSLHLSWNFINPVMVGNLFVLLALRRLLRMYRVQEITAMIYDAGVFVGIAALFFPPLLLAFPLLWLSLGQLRTFNFREWLVPLTGLLTPVFYVVMYYWWFDVHFDFSRYILNNRDASSGIFTTGSLLFYATLTTSVFVLLAGMLRFVREMSVSTVHKKNTKKVFVTLSVLLAVVWTVDFWIGGYHPGMTGLFAIPVSVFAGVFFSHIWRRKVQIVLFYIWFFLLLVYPVFADLF